MPKKSIPVTVARVAIVFVLAFAYGLHARDTLASESMRVFKSEKSRYVKWPLKVDSGSIECEWKFFPAGRKRPLVLFRTSTGKVYGINGAASGVGGYQSIDTIIADKRTLTFGSASVLHGWIQVGLALCDGNTTKARMALSRANAEAEEELPSWWPSATKNPKKLRHQQRIFIELVKCEDLAYEKMSPGGPYPEAIEIECKEKLRKHEKLSQDEIDQIARQGIREMWEMP